MFDETYFYFIISRGNQKIELKTKSEETYHNFLSQIRRRCILTKITKDFKFGSVVGMGAFSKVHKVYNVNNNREVFAVKETLKEKLNADKKGKVFFFHNEGWNSKRDINSQNT